MEKISSSFFNSRGGRRIHKRVRLMPLYGFPHHKDLGHKNNRGGKKFFIHLDFDAFFAQVEQRDNPKLRGKPISVGGNGGIKGIVMTASYEARAYGVKTGMSVFEALQYCPDLISVPCYGQKYEVIMQHMLSEFAKHMPEDCIEQYSIDECFLDISPIVDDYFQAVRFACKIKKLVRDLERLTVSLGVSFNKTWAKMATKLQKPDGLTVLREENREDVYKLPASKIWGVGSRIERRLKLMGIVTLGNLANAGIHALHKEFGINGIILGRLARGEDTSAAVQSLSNQIQRHAKSFNHHHTLTDPIYEPQEIENEIRRMVEYVSRKLRHKDLVTRYFILTIRYDDLGFVSEKIRLSYYTSDERQLFCIAMFLLRKFPVPCITHKARMFGVTVFDLRPDSGANLDLFRKYLRFPFKEMDYLKEKYGEKIIRIGLNSL